MQRKHLEFFFLGFGICFGFRVSNFGFLNVFMREGLPYLMAIGYWLLAVVLAWGSDVVYV